MTMTDEKSSDNRSFPENASPDPVTHGNVQMTATETIELSADKPADDFSPLASGLNSHQKQLQTNNNYNSMNTSFDNNQARNEFNAIDSASVVQSVGHLLRNARTAKGLSIDDVSRQLRLSAQQIEAIEKEDFEKLPGRTFLRGFIRNYANLVQLNPVPLLQMLPESTRVISTYERTPFKNKQISFSSNREKPGNHSLIIAIILFVIILGAYFLFENGGWNKNSDISAESEEKKTESATASVEIQLPLPGVVKNTPNTPNSTTNKPSEVNNPVPATENTAAQADVKTESAPENKPAVEKTEKTEKTAAFDKNTGHLYFKLTADSWIKVVDGRGVTVFEQLKKSGSEQIVTGKRPLSLVIGNAAGVNLTYNDKEIDISSYKKQGGTARFTLE
ncbi:MAG: helix-turn-helix domain-containing protein [Nitrosomonas oligotropha]|uniref:Helix-turn-helix domain-containing protein n=1 Tax=Nitrosomonas oligotropha TaxID=42354 RepID=A0A5C7VR68_9PROT|nr:MAG: helix-turn-helix domain-containing protein [Nitrosomonas oligotropha]